MEGKRVDESRTEMSEMIMPNDTNPLNNLMGGNLLRWMDIAGGICAGKHCNSYVATVSVDTVNFKRPIPLGDVITIKACVTRAFNTSVEIFVEVFTANIKGGNNRKANDAYFTFVAIDEVDHKPVKIAPVVPLTESEQQRFDGALRRRQMRLILSGRLKPEDATEVKSLFLK